MSHIVGYSFIGCYTPFVDNGIVYENMTIHECLEYCLYIGREYAGLDVSILKAFYIQWFLHNKA